MGSLKPGQVSGGDLPWHALRSRPSSLQLPWTPLSYRCWLPSSAVLPVSWLVLCWRYCCWPLECWVGFSDTLFSSQSPRLTWRSDFSQRWMFSCFHLQQRLPFLPQAPRQEAGVGVRIPRCHFSMCKLRESSCHLSLPLPVSYKCQRSSS